MLQTAIRAPEVYIWAQLPVIVNNYGNIDPAKLGSQIILDKLTSCRIVNVLSIGSDTLDFQLEEAPWKYSPLNNTSAWGAYFAVGAVDIKYQAFLGMTQNGATSTWSKGVYVSETITQEAQDGVSKFQVNCLDQFSLFKGDAYTSFPPRLYGQQNSSYYNPNYVLTNPSGDGKTYVGDTAYWLNDTTISNFPIWASDYITPAVYSSGYSSGITPVPNSGSTAYTINYNTGTVTFTTAQTGNPTISVDVRPIAMRPEVALQHLFVDFGSWSPDFIKFDQTGVMIPLTDLPRDRSLIDIASDLTAIVGPRGQRWRLWIDEQGFLRFSEQAPDGPPVATLIDTRDIIKCSPEYSVKDMYNVVRANGVLANNQPITVDSYDIYSISTYTQKPTYDVPTQFVNQVKCMDAGSGLSYLNNLCNSILFEYCRPSLITEIEILPNPAFQVGDVISVIESKTGINMRFVINQITNDIRNENWTQTLRLERQILSQDWNFGIASNLGVTSAQNADGISAQSGFLTDVSLTSNGVTKHVISNGQPLLDSAYQPYIFQWIGDSLGISITIGNIPTTSPTTNLYIWRWMYIAEDAYINGQVMTGDGSGAITTPFGGTTTTRANDLNGSISGYNTLPYDVRTNTDTPMARRFWWPLMRCSDWITNDGTTVYSTTTTLTSTWSNGPGISGSSPYRTYGQLVVGKNDFFNDTTAGFVGVQLYKTGTYAAKTLGTTSNINYGVDFGTNIGTSSQPVYYGIKNKQTPCYLCILVASDAGTMQFKKIPFQLVL